MLDIAKDTHVSAKVTHFVFSTAGKSDSYGIAAGLLTSGKSELGGRGVRNVTGAYLQALVLRKWVVNEQCKGSGIISRKRSGAPK